MVSKLVNIDTHQSYKIKAFEARPRSVLRPGVKGLEALLIIVKVIKICIIA